MLSWSELPEASRTLMDGPVSASCMTDSLEILAARSSGLTPPGPWEKGVGAGVAGRPVLPPLEIPSVSTLSLLIPAVSCSASRLWWRAGEGEKGVGVGVAVGEPRADDKIATT